jgi:hypothetical protein
VTKRATEGHFAYCGRPGETRDLSRRPFLFALPRAVAFSLGGNRVPPGPGCRFATMSLLPFSSQLIADVGISFGDEGKGRLIPEVADELRGTAHPVSVVLKVNGGANSGHTAGGIKLNLLPAGVVVRDAPHLCIGSGVVADPRKIWWETRPLENKGYAILSRLLIDERTSSPTSRTACSTSRGRTTASTSWPRNRAAPPAAASRRPTSTRSASSRSPFPTSSPARTTSPASSPSAPTAPAAPSSTSAASAKRPGRHSSTSSRPPSCVPTPRRWNSGCFPRRNSISPVSAVPRLSPSTSRR